MKRQKPGGAGGGITYEHRFAFWTGVLTVTVGVLLQLPMYFMARMDHYRLAGMPVSTEMIVGMILLGIGIVLTCYGLFPKSSVRKRAGARIKVTALDETPLRPAHVGLVLVLSIAITIDVMKPTTLAFIAPGVAAEYGLRSPLNPTAHALSIALYPLCAVAGLIPGSLLWGWLGDRIGRRAAILIAAVVFIATSTCGTMPEYWLNLLTCFVMGLAAGGMLPIAFTLMAEAIPARHRGWLMVLIGGNIAVAYLVTSTLAATLASPAQFGWRFLWLVGLPTGLLLLLLNKWIPESPRFLIEQGREEEAGAVLARYGAKVTVEDPDRPAGDLGGADRGGDTEPGFGRLFRRPFVQLSVILVLLGVGVGITQYGFQQWMPSNLERLGLTSSSASAVLRNSSLLGFPLSLPVALLYGFWSSKKTIALMGGATVLALLGFVIAGDGLVGHPGLLTALLIVPVWGIGILNSVLGAYAAEVYPTVIRSRGGGLSAGATKLGGLVVLGVVAAAIAAPSIRFTALLGAVPIAMAVVAVVVFGPETRNKHLERISAEELGVVPGAIGGT